jgi:xanthine dehydrogenase accessory factor
MLGIAAELDAWCREGRDFAVATVVAVGGSAPRRPGAALAVDAAGTALGGVSGGCVEAAVYELCREALERGTPLMERFGHADAEVDADDPFAAGLTCGGSIEVLVTPVRARDPARPALAGALRDAAAGRATALVRLVTGPEEPGDPEGPRAGALAVGPDGSHAGTLGGPAALDRAAATEATAMLGLGRTGTIRLAPESATARPFTLLVESRPARPRMLIFGAVDVAAALARAGAFLGYRVTVCDARPVFATARRFPAADEVVVDWPHRYLDAQRQRLDGRAVICALTHDARFDVPLLARALRLPVAYVGAMGSRRTHADRLRRLREAGVTEGELARLRSPIGLDLGAGTPEETALSIAAEIVAARHGGSGVPLASTDTPIHHDAPHGAVGSAHDDAPHARAGRAEPRAA